MCIPLQERTLQRLMFVLATHTGWPLNELLDLPVETLLDFCEHTKKDE